MPDTGIIYYPRGERVTARIAPAPAPWEVLTADHARDYANYFTGMLELETADHFIAYADAWDAMTQPAPWEVLTAQQARQIAGVLAEYGIAAFSWKLRHYADAVDAMTQPPRIEYETETA